MERRSRKSSCISIKISQYKKGVADHRVSSNKTGALGRQLLDPMCMSDYNKITGISGCIPDVSEMTESRSLPVSCAEAGKSYIQR